MEYEQFSKIYNALKESINTNDSLSQDDVIKAIKGQLLPDSDAYKECKKGNFSLDHVFTTVPDRKRTLLTTAFNRADLKVANFLIKVGADVNAVDENGLTQLIIAIEKKFDDPINKGLVDLLIEKAKADVNTAGADGMTPISKAVERGDLETFEALVKNGANVNIRVYGMSLLKWAEDHKSINKENMEKIIDVLKAPSKEKEQNSESTGKQTPVNGSNKTPAKNDTTFLSKHKGKIALGVVGLCVVGAIAAYVLAYPVVALVLEVSAV
ncbi:ankyrin repeat domain-containing protein [Wolbachia pipientis]|uniref:ankyrin repeat domain-containing protein n=1 Tax=Wolbachia pipientis TaxID=955 RepID=UPI0015F9DEAE|nr:ankyrin repeat domain-containing protein [Wolbachia pipientis]